MAFCGGFVYGVSRGSTERSALSTADSVELIGLSLTLAFAAIT